MKISIITVCLNSEELEKTINSVLNQTYKNYDYWIIDGKSTNAITLNTLNKYKDHNKVNIISEKDGGIYDAMNKGIRLSNGDYLIFLNAGDSFYTNESLQVFATQHDNYEIVYGDLEMTNTKSNWIVEYPPKLSYSFFLENTLPHPACFIKKSVFEKVNLYETNMLISADWAFFIKAICLRNVSYKHLPTIISSFDHNGISSDLSNQNLIHEEKKQFLENNFSLFIDDFTEYKETKRKFTNLKNSRLRKYLSYIFKQLHI